MEASLFLITFKQFNLRLETIRQELAGLRTSCRKYKTAYIFYLFSSAFKSTTLRTKRFVLGLQVNGQRSHRKFSNPIDA
ncbi:hypothetical protein Pla100_55940 [Neorhodopirellula pilleata]|uniref:Uncharacterized protein n=1 Tax=Neorhodopirellula pilleata TaxID=2714738 RepID=A0A5C5ZQT9_9BACT|nr:hypothetical protein Pla100_55940 [Neorhodopirellula pilleata]